ncbi:hypothetical protein A6E01_20135 (plasmid) [Vibrio breoganii]|uniref:SHOCT domain-containing protein n=1 Tax=Vibrio breoganii TaxID=553239 RepID=A0AAN0Y039_9VIBR|nr:hypothetical protein A6E01_20135 [Vibrio breoganii]
MTSAIALGALAIYLFFLPTIIARKKNHPNKTAILLINVFGTLVWGVGWLIALIWSLFGNSSDIGMNRGEIADEIEKLDALRKSGAITEAEFQKRKTFLLNY